MKTIRRLALLAPLWANIGCHCSCPFFCTKTEAPPPPPPVVTKPSKPPVMVTADQVSKTNARDMAESLRKELELDAK